MHEHWDDFALINMNGRVYDPVIARFLSPDPYVQAPDYSQSFNRYSYVYNNPLVYIDPDGEFAWFVPIIIGAFTGSYIGGAIAAGEGGLRGANWNPFGGKSGSWDGTDWWKGAIVGGFIGASAGYLWSAAVGPAGGITQNLVGFGKAAWQVTGRGLLSATQNMLFSQWRGEDDIWKSGITGFASGALTRGIDYKRKWAKGFLKNVLVQGSIGSSVDALDLWLSEEDITLSKSILSFGQHGLIGGISGGLKSMYEGKNFWTGDYRNTGGPCPRNIYREKWKFNPKGAKALTLAVQINKGKWFNITLGGIKINVNPNYATRGGAWPRFFRNSPILLPGMFWWSDN
jgi:RHS repeat-associated protein